MKSMIKSMNTTVTATELTEIKTTTTVIDGDFIKDFDDPVQKG